MTILVIILGPRKTWISHCSIEGCVVIVVSNEFYLLLDTRNFILWGYTCSPKVVKKISTRPRKSCRLMHKWRKRTRHPIGIKMMIIPTLWMNC